MEKEKVKELSKKNVKVELESENGSNGIEPHFQTSISESFKNKVKDDINTILKILDNYESPYQRYLIDKVREKSHIKDTLGKYDKNKIVLKYHKEVNDMIWAFKQLAWRVGFIHKFEKLDYYPELHEAVVSDLDELLSNPSLFVKNQNESF